MLVMAAAMLLCDGKPSPHQFLQDKKITSLVIVHINRLCDGLCMRKLARLRLYSSHDEIPA
jgi:hypothetical protein